MSALVTQELLAGEYISTVLERVTEVPLFMRPPNTYRKSPTTTEAARALLEDMALLPSHWMVEMSKTQEVPSHL